MTTLELQIDDFLLQTDYNGRPVSLPKRAAITRRLISLQVGYDGLPADFRKSMGMRCGTFPRGCFAMPASLAKASEVCESLKSRRGKAFVGPEWIPRQFLLATRRSIQTSGIQTGPGAVL